MYQQALSVRYKHKLSLKTAKDVAYMGDVTSYSDSSAYRIASALVMQEARLSEYPAMASGTCASFLLSVPHDPRSKIADYLGYLRKNKHKAALVYFDSAGSSGLLLPMNEGDKQSVSGSDGFRCFIMNLKGGDRQVSFSQPVAPKIVAPTYSPVHPSSTGSNFETKHGAEQQAAASHYNDLKRDRSSRHLSHIFHLRNLNNVIKTEIINNAALKAKLDAINQRGEILQGVSVIDFGCGMGGDIFKWMKNPSGLARYVGVDIAHNSLKQFTERLLTSSSSGADKSASATEHAKVTHLVCADIGTESLTESALPCHTWRSGNLTQGSWDTRVPLTEADQFDIASCQFAMHYMFQSSAKAHHFFRQIARHLKPGGVFIATTMDCRVVAEAVEELLYGCFDERQSREKMDDMLTYGGISGTTQAGSSGAAAATSSEGTATVDPFARIRDVQRQHSAAGQQKVLTYRNDVNSEVLQLKFEDDMWPRLLRLRGDTVTPTSTSTAGQASASAGVSADADRDDESAYGIKYTFTLHDSEEDAAVDAPEWVVPLGRTLGALAAAHGLRLAEVQNFQHMASEMMANESKLRRMESMHVFNCKGALSEAEWRVARLYLKLVFVKDANGGDEPMEPSSPTSPPPGYPRAPSSPEGPPPDWCMQGSHTPDGPPPGFWPSSPDMPPPGFAPSSPDMPPPGFVPSSPDMPPPGYFPSSPDGPPPGFVPASPDMPPPGYFPSSPTCPPPPLAAQGRVAKRPLSYESDDDEPPSQAAHAGKKSRPTPVQSMSVPKFATSYESESEEEENPFMAKPAPTAPALSSSHRMTSYGSDDDEGEANPFFTAPAASSGAPAVGQAKFMTNYGSDEEQEEEINPFLAKPASAGNVVPSGPTGSMNKYGSDDEYEERRNSPARAPFFPSSPTSPPPPRGNDWSSGPASHPRNPYEDSSGGEQSDTEADMDPAVLRLMRVRDLAIELSGGLDVWDDLDDDSIEQYMEQAHQQYVD